GRGAKKSWIGIANPFNQLLHFSNIMIIFFQDFVLVDYEKEPSGVIFAKTDDLLLGPTSIDLGLVTLAVVKRQVQCVAYDADRTGNQCFAVRYVYHPLALQY